MPAATILVVDDEEAVRAVIARTLESAGFTVLEAEHGEAALSVVRGFSGVLALAIVDMNMPVMTGREFAREFRPMRPSVPVLFITGREPMVPGARLLLKPFGPDELLERVAQVLGDAQGAERTGA
jgi:two-component system, cell cycle sensor histidine kinase and response regulator CckA